MASGIQNHKSFTAKSMTRPLRSNTHARAFGKVAVLFGGRSAEREVSLQSGQNVLEALLRQGIDAHHLDVDENLATNLIEGKYQRAFIVLHGREGEDGVVQGLLQMLGIPFTGSGVAASALAMDKARAKLVMHGLKIPTPPFGLARTIEQANEIAQKIGFPLCVKPVAEGSSIGITRVNQLRELAPAFIKAVQYGDVLVEKWVEGKQFTVGIIGDRILPSIEIQVPGEFYDYEAKYESNETRYLCPSPLNAQKEKILGELACRSFYALGCEGWGRVDLIQDQQGKFWVLEVNTIPGMTSHSLIPKAAKAIGMNFDEVVVAILETTMEAVPASPQELVSEIA